MLLSPIPASIAAGPEPAQGFNKTNGSDISQLWHIKLHTYFVADPICY